jgi:enoyl-CoA hydratase/carnithine racemase
VGATAIPLATDKIVAYADAGVGWLVFNNPERRNAMSEEMWAGAATALEALAKDEAVRVILLRGAGDKAFVSGGDISEFEDKMAGRTAAAEARARYAAASGAFMRAIGRLQKPLIAVIHGACFGGGLLVALQADMRLAATTAKFSIPASKMGIGYPYDQVERLARLVGPAVAADILFTARILGADEAKHVGLVNDIVAPDELEAAAQKTAAVIAENAPLTVRAAKAAVQAYMQDAQARDLAAVDALVRACGNSEDFLEGTRAFLEKRKPRFAGK